MRRCFQNEGMSQKDIFETLGAPWGVSKATVVRIIRNEIYVDRDYSYAHPMTSTEFVRDAVAKMSPTQCFTEWPYKMWAGQDRRPSVPTKREDGTWTQVYAFRYAWFLLHGRWNEGWLLHTCHNKDCFNPWHGEENGTPALNRQQMIEAGRGPRQMNVSCEKGHPWTEENTYYRPDNGARQCLTCRDERNRQRYIRER